MVTYEKINFGALNDYIMELSIYGSGIDSGIIDILREREVEDYETIEWGWIHLSKKDSDNKVGLIHHFEYCIAN